MSRLKRDPRRPDFQIANGLYDLRKYAYAVAEQLAGQGDLTIKTTLRLDLWDRNQITVSTSDGKVFTPVLALPTAFTPHVIRAAFVDGIRKAARTHKGSFMYLKFHRYDHRPNEYDFTLTETRQDNSVGPIRINHTASLTFNAEEKQWYHDYKPIDKQSPWYTYFWICWNARTFSPPPEGFQVQKVTVKE